MSRGGNKEMAEIVKKLRKAGCEVWVGGSGHYRAQREGCRAVTFPMSPSDVRSVLNTRSMIKRHLNLEV